MRTSELAREFSMKSLKNNILNVFFKILDHQMIFESAGDSPTSVEAKGEAGFFFPAPPSLFFAGKGNHQDNNLKKTRPSTQ